MDIKYKKKNHTSRDGEMPAEITKPLQYHAEHNTPRRGLQAPRYDSEIRGGGGKQWNVTVAGQRRKNDVVLEGNVAIGDSQGAESPGLPAVEEVVIMSAIVELLCIHCVFIV
jgi:hypothetical protein